MRQLMNLLDLNGDWTLHYGLQKTAACALDHPAIPDSFATCPARVPGNVELDLVRAGVLPQNLDHGANIYTLLDYEEHQWWLTRTFEIPSLASYPDPILSLHGIDTLATVWLNDRLVGRTENMLIPHVLDIEGALCEGTNRLTIALDSPVLAALEYRVDAGCFAMENNWESLHIRKASHSYGWDIMPRAVSAGLWRDITIGSRPAVHFDDVYVATLKTDAAQRSANILMQWTLVSSGPVERGSFVRIQITDPSDGLVVHDNTIAALSWTGRYEAEIDNVDLWYPRGAGTQTLYDVDLTCTDEGGATIAQWSCRTGFRTVELRKSDLLDAEGNGEFRFLVNGREVFIKGSNWVPLDAFHSRDAERLQDTLDLMVELNCNMIRCWGGNVYEDKPFFDFCDENGILVWQDFALACALYPQTPEFHAKIRQEAEAIVPKLRNHPSLALWAGNNEIDQFYLFAKPGVNPNDDDLISRSVLPEVCRRLDPYRDYLPSSPYYSQRNWEAGIDNNAPEEHLWGPRDDFKSPYYTRSTACFASEIGYHGCPSRSSLERMMRPEHLWPWQDNPDWLTHAVRPQPASTKYNYRISLMATQLRNLFGEVPEKLNDYVRASQISQAEALKFFVEMFRIQKGRTGGLLWWNIRDGWPEISDAVVDYYGERKLAFHLLKELHTPVHVMLGEQNNRHHEVVAVNDSTDSIALTGRVICAGKTVAQFDGELCENARLSLGRVPVPDSFTIFELEWSAGTRPGRGHFLAGPRPFPVDDVTEFYQARFARDWAPVGPLDS